MSNVTPLTPRKQLEIPQEHVPQLFNSLLCEKLCHFTRTLNPAGQWEWLGETSDGSPPPTELFDFVHIPALALDLLERVCIDQNWGYGISLDPPNGAERLQHNIAIVRRTAQGDLQQLSAVSQAHLIGFGIALALTQVFQMDVPAQHRELFPAHYMGLNQ